MPVDVLIHDPVWIRAWKIIFNDTEPISPVCDPKAKYRTFDGSCNNLKNPVLGTPFQPQARFLKPDYEDGKLYNKEVKLVLRCSETL